jgi:hypothetical protein
MGVASRILASAQYRLSARSAYVDLHSHPEDTIFLVGSRRSGTTWLSETINYRNQYRTIFEPFHPLHSRWARVAHSEWAKFVEPDYDDPALEQQCRRLWEGRVRDPWIDKHNTKRVATRRLVKAVESTNLLPWIESRWPELKVVYVLRHPFATSESQLEVDFQDDGLTDLTVLRGRPRLVEGVCRTLRSPDAARHLVVHAEDPFEQHVVRWCLENRAPLAMLRPDTTHVVLYEDAVLQIGSELTRLGQFVGQSFDDAALEAARRPSRTDFRHRAERQLGKVPAQTFLGEWQQHVSAAQVETGMAVLRAFEVDHLYGADPFPLVDGARALLATQALRADGHGEESSDRQTAPGA